MPTDSSLLQIISIANKVADDLGIDTTVMELRIESYDVSACRNFKEAAKTISFQNGLNIWIDGPSVSPRYKFIGSLERYELDAPEFTFDREIYFHLLETQAPRIMDWHGYSYSYSDGFHDAEKGTVLFSRIKNLAHKVYVYISP